MKFLLFLVIWIAVSMPLAILFGKIAKEMGKEYPLVEDRDDEIQMDGTDTTDLRSL